MMIRHLRVWALLPLLAPGLLRGREAPGDPEPDSTWRVERSSDLAAVAGLPPLSLQLLAERIGAGAYAVRTVPVEASAPGGPEFLFVRAADGSGGERGLFYGGQAAPYWVRLGTESDLVTAYLQSQPSSARTEAGLRTALGAAVGAVAYAGSARLQQVAALSFDPAMPAPSKHAAAGGWLWSATYLLPSGATEQVTAVVPAAPESLTKVARSSAAGSGPAEAALPSERWVITKEKNWTPNRRYGSAYSMALLGQTQMKVRLGTSLLNETDPSSVAKGLILLNSAAADGSSEAVHELIALGDRPIRPSRERDGVRMDWCDCFLVKKMAVR